MIQEVYVGHTSGRDTRGDDLLYEIQHTLGISSISQVRTAKVYRIEGINEDQARRFAEIALVDIGEFYSVNRPIHTDGTRMLKVGYLPGVMNPESASLNKVAGDLSMKDISALDSIWAYTFYGQVGDADLETIAAKLLVNKTVEQVIAENPATLQIKGEPGTITTIPLISMGDEELMGLSKDKLFLNLEEMHAIQKYFADAGRNPTDGELETLAQTWSEHCVHKTFRAPLEVDGEEKPSLFSRLRKASEKYSDGVVSAFVDNSGVIKLYDEWSICGKVETHNSPSAIEPYGGAMTGSGGVFRDIMGTGQGAKVIASTDMFCVAPPNLPNDHVPPGCLHPRYLLRRVVSGVRDYGNRMGIPTNNGSVHFHPDFRAKPSVIVGAYGLIPTELAQKGKPKPGDKVVVIGGRTGRDGIHGATFSSAAMTSRTGQVNSSAVQIGNAVEEKRMVDALLECRDAGLIRAVTDCGAGGFSSAIGEMGSRTGVQVELEKAPLKYEGLAPWEVWISESQERMVLAVAPENVDRVLRICKGRNVEATVLGTFTDTHHLNVGYNGQNLCDLDMEFLHDGVPISKLKARKAETQPAVTSSEREPRRLTTPDDWQLALTKVLSFGDICSKEPIVRMYDHNVQGSSALTPFTGVHHDGPSDAAIVAPVLGKFYGMIIAHGLNPVLTRIDPYNGALWSAMEAISNACAAGAKLEDLALVDNFIWPAPDEHWLWALDQAIEACISVMDHLHIPFISGKDSLSSTYRWPDGSRLDIPPVLCVSAFGRIPDVRKTVSTDFKQEGSSILLIGDLDAEGLGGSAYAASLPENLSGEMIKRGPKADIASFSATVGALHKAIQSGHVLACHDISQGGLATALAEMSLGGELGVRLHVNQCGEGNPDALLFSETTGCFVVETQDVDKIIDYFESVPVKVIGYTTAAPRFIAEKSGTILFNIELPALKRAWKQPMQELFH